jgi:hypothetical protein
MNSKKEIKNSYKETGTPMGVFVVKNQINNRVLLGASMNVLGALNRCRFELKVKSHRNKELMIDWLKHGSDNFTFDIIDTIEKRDDPNHNYVKELSDLLSIWLNEYQPYDDRGYNKKDELRVR